MRAWRVTAVIESSEGDVWVPNLRLGIFSTAVLCLALSGCGSGSSGPAAGNSAKLFRSLVRIRSN